MEFFRQKDAFSNQCASIYARQSIRLQISDTMDSRLIGDIHRYVSNQKT